MTRKLSAFQVVGSGTILSLGFVLGSCATESAVTEEAGPVNSFVDSPLPGTGPVPLDAALTQTDVGKFLVGDDGGSYAFTSADGEDECMFSAVDRPDAMVNGFFGGCGPAEADRSDGAMVFMVTGPGRPGSFASPGEGYPGDWYPGRRALQVGEYVDLGGQVACFSVAEDVLGCLEYGSGEGYQLVGGQFHPFGRDRLGEVFDTGEGTVQLLSRRVVFDLGDGEILACRLRAGMLVCHGGSWGENGHDTLWFDAIGGANAPVGEHPPESGDLPPVRAQEVGPGRYLIGEVVVENSGGRLTFTRKDGSSFWVTPEGHGGGDTLAVENHSSTPG